MVEMAMEFAVIRASGLPGILKKTVASCRCWMSSLPAWAVDQFS
jgi:hypothetical protein